MNLRIRKLIMFFAAAMMGMLIGIAAIKLSGLNNHVRHARHTPVSPGLIAVYVLNILLTAIAVVCLHECGHYLAGRFVGFRGELLTFGPLRWERSKQTALGWSLNRDIQSMGGMCMMLPMDRNNLTRRFTIMIAGGPLASLAGAAFAAGLLAALPHSVPLLRLTCGMALAMSGGIALVTLLPIASSTYESDGRKLLLLRNGGLAADRMAAMLELMGSLHQGKRPAELAPDLFETLALKDNTVTEGLLNYFAYIKALDANCIQEAEAYLTRMAETMGGHTKALDAMVNAEQAYFHAWYLRRRPEPIAYDLLQPFPGLKYRSRAAALFQDGAIQEALSVIESAITELRSRHENVFDVCQLEKMRSEITSQLAA
jgi:hypothetical protein